MIVEDAGGGRGRASTVRLSFAQTGPWCDGEINASLFEAVLGHSHARSAARLLLAAMAALADEDGVLERFTTDELCAVAGLADSTYRRARKALLASGELVLLDGAGGRGKTNRWKVEPHRDTPAEPASPRARRVAPPRGALPLLAPIEPHSALGASSADQKGAHGWMVGSRNRPIPTGVAGRKGAQDRTLSGPSVTYTPAKRAPETPSETPPSNPRAGREPQNPRISEDPPNPPEGGRLRDSILVEQTYRTPRGRTRRRAVRVDLDDVRSRLGVPGPDDHADWRRIRELLAAAVGETTFAIWLEPLELVALDEQGNLVVRAPAATRVWLWQRFSRVIADCGLRGGRQVQVADEAQIQAIGA